MSKIQTIPVMFLDDLEEKVCLINKEDFDSEKHKIKRQSLSSDDDVNATSKKTKKSRK